MEITFENFRDSLLKFARNSYIEYDVKELKKISSFEEFCSNPHAPKWAYWYAKHISKTPDLEPIIDISTKYSYLYAKNVLSGRFELGEKKILASPSFSKPYKKFESRKEVDSNVPSQDKTKVYELKGLKCLEQGSSPQGQFFTFTYKVDFNPL